MAAIKLVSTVVNRTKSGAIILNGLSAGTVNPTERTTGDYAQYIALQFAYDATLAVLCEQAHGIMCDVTTVEEFDTVRKAFQAAYDADYVKRFKQGDLSEKEWTKKIANAHGVAWKRLWERAELHTGADVTPWVSPVEKKTRAPKAPVAGADNAPSQSAIESANPFGSHAVEVPAELAGVIAWAMSDAANLAALVEWQANASKPQLTVVPTPRKPRGKKTA